jgi:hypothetical protein
MKGARKTPLRIRSGNPTDLWSQVAAKEADERRQFDPLLRSFAILADEHLEQTLSIVDRRDSEDQRRKLLIQDMLFELAWRTDFRRTEEPIEESHFWDELRAFIRRHEENEGITFQFPVWTIHLGRKIANAWMCRDDEFFARHADLWRELCQTEGKAEGRVPTHVARICGVALALQTRLKCDPTKKQLRDEVAKLGLRISEKDWPKYLRKCALTFLPQAKSGRPRSRNLSAS